MRRESSLKRHVRVRVLQVFRPLNCTQTAVVLMLACLAPAVGDTGQPHAALLRAKLDRRYGGWKFLPINLACLLMRFRTHCCVCHIDSSEASMSCGALLAISGGHAAQVL